VKLGNGERLVRVVHAEVKRRLPADREPSKPRARSRMAKLVAGSKKLDPSPAPQ
jgi:hypothetical protein